MTEVMFDPDLIAAARDLRWHCDTEDWERFVADHPELADATDRLLRDSKGIGSPKGYEPHRCWSRDADRGRWYRKRQSWAEDDPRATDPMHYETLRGDGDRSMSLLALHTELGEDGYGITGKVIASQHQLEVCRLCGGEIADLTRNADGLADRSAGGQSQYCSGRCRKDVKNARERALRHATKPPKSARALPDLSTIHIAGIGDLGIDPAEWNRLQPRHDQHAFTPVPISDGRVGYELPVHRFMSNLRHRPCWAADKWIRVGPRSAAPTADRIARRYRSAGTSTPKGPELTPDWDRVVSSWKFVPRYQPTQISLSCSNNAVWRISHCDLG